MLCSFAKLQLQPEPFAHWPSFVPFSSAAGGKEKIRRNHDHTKSEDVKGRRRSGVRVLNAINCDEGKGKKWFGFTHASDLAAAAAAAVVDALSDRDSHTHTTDV